MADLISYFTISMIHQLWIWILAKIQKHGLPSKAKALARLQASPIPETIKELNELLQKYYHFHTFVLEPTGDTTWPSNRWPRFSFDTASGICILTLYSWSGYSKEENHKVIREIRRWIRSHALKGLLIDLREHEGGNMWPFLQGLSPLLGGSSLLAFGLEKESRKTGENWINMGKLGGIHTGTYVRRDLPFRVAVLVGKHTGSSGEFTALVFHGRKHARLFGATTAGYTSNNTTFRYRKSVFLNLTTHGVTGYNGRFYNGGKHPILPDVIIRGDPMKEAKAYVMSA
jgi:hypothetical protein